MTRLLKQSTAITVPVGPFLDSGDGVTEETGLTIAQADIRLRKNGGTFAQSNNAAGATHDENGYYGVPLDTTDTNTLGPMRLAIHMTGAIPVWEDFLVVPANNYDWWVSLSALLGVDVQELSGDSTAADNAESFFDGTGYAGTGNTIPTVTTTTDVTNEVSADVTKISGSSDAADNLEASSLAIVTGAAATGTLSTTQMTTDLTEATDDHYAKRVVVWTSGALAGQGARISAYNGTTKMLTFSTVTEAPSDGDTFVIV